MNEVNQDSLNVMEAKDMRASQIDEEHVIKALNTEEVRKAMD